MWYRGGAVERCSAFKHPESIRNILEVHMTTSRECSESTWTRMQITQACFHQHEFVWILCVCVLTTCRLTPRENKKRGIHFLWFLRSQIPHVHFWGHWDLPRGTGSHMRITMGSHATRSFRDTNATSHWMQSTTSRRLPASCKQGHTHMHSSVVQKKHAWISWNLIVSLLSFAMCFLFESCYTFYTFLGFHSSILPCMFHFHVADLGTLQYLYVLMPKLEWL